MATPTQKAAIATLGVGALAWLCALLPTEEGVMLYGYNDPLGIPTKCMGDTHNVIVGHKYSSAECKQSMMEQVIAHAQPVLKAAPALKEAPDSVLAAAISWNYKSGAFPRQPWLIDAAQRKDWPEFCRRLMVGPNGQLWYVTGRDRKTGQRVALKGLLKRAGVEYAMCVNDLHLPDAQRMQVTTQAEADFARIAKMQPVELAQLQGGEP